MMTKWADYLISAVRFEETHISQMKVHIDLGHELTDAEVWTRTDVLKALDKDKTFKTILIGNNGWQPGETVIKVKIGKEHYIKTKADDKMKDNLDNLPPF